MRVVFMGTPDYGAKILEGLLQYFTVVGVFTQPDKPVGRKQILTPPAVKRLLLQRNPSIALYQPKTLKSQEVVDVLRDLSPDFIVVAAYGQILPSTILSIAPCINLHASLLPKYRGASPIQHALLHGERVSGVTAMLMDEGLDTGDILAYSVVPIAHTDNALTLFEKLALEAKELTPLVLKRFDEILPLAQNSVDATYCKKIRKSDGLVHCDDAKEVFNRYRAFIAWPGIYLASGLKLKKIELVQEDGSFTPGEILQVDEDGLLVGCKRGVIKVIVVQPPSKKEMAAIDYIRGKRIGVGDTLL